jgi:hypothetical protein
MNGQHASLRVRGIRLAGKSCLFRQTGSIMILERRTTIWTRGSTAMNNQAPLNHKETG